MVMNNVLCNNSGIDQDIHVAIEYQIPLTSKRVDFLVTGYDDKGKENVVIVELKQWAKVEMVDDLCDHSIMSDLKSHEPTAHPSYQAYSYKCLILDYCDDQNFNDKTLKFNSKEL